MRLLVLVLKYTLPLAISNAKLSEVPDLASTMLLFGAPLPRSMILSQFPTVPVKRTTATIVRPPLVAIFNVRFQASRYCNWVRLKVTWPLPCGPPVALYTGKIVDSKGVLPRVDVDANVGSTVRATKPRAKNLWHMVPEPPQRRQLAVVYPALHAHAELSELPVGALESA
jgi:hypothetical protein